jgi:hypothetical protein
MFTYARRVRGLLIALLIFCAGAFAPASAQAKVHVDPNSAPGKEYEVPLDRVRHDAAPGGGSNSGQPPAGGGQSTAPAFGVGLSAKASQSGGRGRGGAERGGDTGSPGEAGAAEGPRGASPSGSGTQVTVRTAGSSDGGVGPTLAFSALGVGTLLLGGLVGLMLRRRTRQEAL